MKRQLLLTLGLGLAAAACKDEPKVDPVVAPTPASPTAAVAERPKAPQAETVTVVASRTGLRKAPTEDAKADDPAGSGKKVSNWIALLHRGERVELVETSGDWAKVRLSDGSEGYTSARSLLTAEGLREATVVDTVQSFERPDLVAVGRTKLEPGTLLFVVGERDTFSQVNHRTTHAAWVLTDKLSSDAAEVQLAKMLERAKYLLEREKGKGTAELLEVARGQFAGAKLLVVLESLVSPAAAPADGEPAKAPEAPADPAE